MIEKYTIDMLTIDSVSIKKQLYTDYMGQQYPIGEPWRRSYTNDNQGRQQILDELPEMQVNSILAIWGDSPTIETEE